MLGIAEEDVRKILSYAAGDLEDPVQLHLSLS